MFDVADSKFDIEKKFGVVLMILVFIYKLLF